MIRLACFFLLVLGFAACAPKKVVLEQYKLPESYHWAESPSNSKQDSGLLVWVKEWRSDSLISKSIRNVLQKNLSLLQTDQELKHAEAEILLIKGARLPQMDLLTGAAIRRFGRYTMDGAGNATTDMIPGKAVPEHLPDYRVAFNAFWNPDLSRELSKQNQAAINRLLGQKALLDFFRTQWTAETIRVYSQLQAAKKAQKLLEQSLTTQDRLLEITRLQLETGRGNAVAEIQLQEQKLDILELQKVISAEEKMFRFKIQQISAELPDNVAVNFNETNASGVLISLPSPQWVVSKRNDLRAAEQFFMASEKEVEAARRAFWPKLTLMSSIGYQAYDTRLLLTTPASVAYTLLADLGVPLLNRSALKARHKSAIASMENAFLKYRQYLNDAMHEVNNAWINFELAAQQLNIARERIQLLKKAERMALTLFEGGKSDYLALLLIREQQIAAGLREVEAEKQYNLSRIDLWLACGAPNFDSF